MLLSARLFYSFGIILAIVGLALEYFVCPGPAESVSDVMLKSISCVAFLLPGCFGSLTLRTRYSRLLFVALLFSYVGDLCLMFYLNQRMQDFGIIAFGLAQITFVVTFLLRRTSWRRVGIVTAILLVFSFVVTVPLMFRLLPPLPELRVLVPAYAAAISFMVGSAFGVKHDMWRIVGACVFYGSDICTGVMMFTEGKTEWAKLLAKPTYVIAQLSFVGSALFGESFVETKPREKKRDD